MERCCLHNYSQISRLKVGGACPAPKAWNSIADVCQDLFRLATDVASGHTKVILSFTFRDTSVSLDLTEAKAASVLCAIGIGFGLGSYFLYKLYCRYVQPDHRKKKKQDKRDESDACVGTEEPVECEMGNSGSSESMPVSYSRANGVQFGSIGLENHVVPSNSRPTRVRQRRRSRNSQRKPTVKREKSEPCLVKRQSPSSVKPIDIRRSKTDNLDERLIHSASDVSNIPPLSGSLKGNLSLRSLYEKNYKYGLDENSESSPQRKTSKSEEENIEVEISESQDLITISSALLTPPSDDDLRNGHRVSELESSEEVSNLNEKNTKPHLQSHDTKVSSVTFSDNTYTEYPTETCNLLNSDTNGNICNDFVPSQEVTESVCNRKNTVELCNIPAQTTDSSNHTSPFHSSGSAKAFSNYTTDISGNNSLDDEERDSSSSPLYKLRSPDRHFRQSLLNRLHEYAKVDCSSTSTSQNSTPDISPYHRARSCSVEIPESASDIATPDSEIFTSSGNIGESTDDCFEQLEHEVYDIEDEFAEISAKLAELKTIASKHSDDFDFQLEYTPSDPVAKKACEIVEKTRTKIHRSNSMSFSESYSSSDGAVDTDGVDLSWDSEHMTSHGKNSPAKQKIGSLPQTMEVQNEVDEDFYTQSDEVSNGVLSSCDENVCNTSETIVPPSGIDAISDVKSRTDTNSLSTCELCGRVLCQEYDNTDGTKCDCTRTDLPDPQETLSGETVETDGTSLDNTTILTADLFPSVDPLTVSTQISDKHDIVEYAKQEWKGKTPKAQLMRKAYLEVPKLTQCTHLHQIRGDNYCGIRGTVFQCLVNSTDITAKWPDVNLVIDSLKMHFNNSSSGLTNWTFANRLPCNSDEKLALLSKCVQCLFSTFDQASNIPSLEERKEWVIRFINSDYSCDIQLMEGVKILMYLNICSLFTASQSGEDVPIFAWLLFARDTSENPAMFVKHHLNQVGDSGGLEQIEMFLLGHTLGVTIQVLRLQQLGQEDFISYYPDDMKEVWPQITLLAEDDRHYNVPVV